MSNYKTDIPKRITLNNNDLILFRAYFDDLVCHTSFSRYKLLKQANLPLTYYNDVKKYLEGKKTFRKHINISLFLHLGLLYSFPLDVSKYIHLLEPLKKAEDT